MADELGYTERYSGQWERGTKRPTLRILADIARVLATDLISGTAESNDVLFQSLGGSHWRHPIPEAGLPLALAEL